MTRATGTTLCTPIEDVMALIDDANVLLEIPEVAAINFGNPEMWDQGTL